MSWRTVVITKMSKLDLKLGQMVVRNETVTKINISEISTLIVENTAVSLTAALLSELIKKKVKVIFCDEKRNPQSELIPCCGAHDSSAKIRAQTEWDPFFKDSIWTRIVTEKITNQKNLLKKLGKKECTLLEKYLTEIQFKDSTNREAHSAKVYFNALFGMDFNRANEDSINAALNYGYSILLSAFNREVTAGGYVTQLGIAHCNTFNPFNLSSDLMEPFRPLVDEEVLAISPEKFGHEEKMRLVGLLNKELVIDGKTQYLSNAVKIYCKSIFDALNNKDMSKLRFYGNEL